MPALQPDYRHMDAAVTSVSEGVRIGATVSSKPRSPSGTPAIVMRDSSAPRAGSRSIASCSWRFPPSGFHGGSHAESGDVSEARWGDRPELRRPRSGFRIRPRRRDREDELSRGGRARKLADTTYRDVNIAFANELAGYAGQIGVDVEEVIQAANSQPYSHIHQPGLGVGGHCIPVYPRFLLAKSPDLELVELSRRINDGQVDVAVNTLEDEFSGLRELPVLVLGLTYREGVKELAYSRGLELVARLSSAQANVSAWDPLLSPAEIDRCGARPWTWGTSSDARAIVVQTADPIFGRLDMGWFPFLEVLLDGRNSLETDRSRDMCECLVWVSPPRGNRRRAASS